MRQKLVIVAMEDQRGRFDLAELVVWIPSLDGFELPRVGMHRRDRIFAHVGDLLIDEGLPALRVEKRRAACDENARRACSSARQLRIGHQLRDVFGIVRRAMLHAAARCIRAPGRAPAPHASARTPAQSCRPSRCRRCARAESSRGRAPPRRRSAMSVIVHGASGLSLSPVPRLSMRTVLKRFSMRLRNGSPHPRLEPLKPMISASGSPSPRIS